MQNEVSKPHEGPGSVVLGDDVVNGVTNIDDDDYLDRLVADVLYADDELSLLDQRLLRRQDRLRQIVSARAWRRYLRVEEVVTAKLDIALTNVAREAFIAGWQAGRAHPHGR